MYTLFRLSDRFCEPTASHSNLLRISKGKERTSEPNVSVANRQTESNESGGEQNATGLVPNIGNRFPTRPRSMGGKKAHEENRKHVLWT